MTYRVIRETNRVGKQIYYVQKRSWLFFWSYFGDVKGMDMVKHRNRYETFEEANWAINNHVSNRLRQRNSDIVKREVLTPNIQS